MQVNVAGLRRNIKNLAHNYSDAQVKVREATSNDPWGPSATIMAEIADLTYNVVAFSEIMQMIWKRLNDHGKNWRHVYKALILLEYLIKTGTEKVAQQCKENIFAIQTLREFTYYEEGKDQGTHVREKAKQLVTLLRDDERLKNERIKALKAKERFAQHPSGFGSDGYIDGPQQRDMPPGWQEEPKSVSELEMVRPQTAGEEELQLQLAMAMSREEAEQEEAKRRSDDVRLQLALSQSEQDFHVKKEEPPSHLLDLLELSMGATSISSPSLAAGGMAADPWGSSGRPTNHLSGTSSPQRDPWQPTAAPRNVQLGAVGGIGAGANGDAWALRTQSPSVASGSSTEGWLQSNGGAGMNGNTMNAAPAPGDPWLGKTAVAPLAAPVDAWLVDGVRPAPAANLLSQQTLHLDDPWAPKAPSTTDDLWKTLAASGMKKPSPDMDEFDIITNRNKTGDLMGNSANNSNNNNASLLDELDPLSLANTSISASTTNSKKPLKTPQAFLGENSALVNLDNLIKPVVPQTQVGNAAYNPFSDTALPPKTNLFQQQQPAVPSINQLKQQQPFAMAINQDPWAPVNNAGTTSQSVKPLVNFDDDSDVALPFNPQPTTSPNFSFMPSSNSLSNARSDYNVFNNNNNSNNNNTEQKSLFSRSHDNLRHWQQLHADIFDSSTELANMPTNYATAYNPTTARTSFDAYALATNSVPLGQQNANMASSATMNFLPAEAQLRATPYASSFAASLAATPGITIAPIYAEAVDATSIGASTAGGGPLFGQGYYKAASNNTNSFYSSATDAAAPCNMENNNNNMPWIKPEAAASNPFLS